MNESVIEQAALEWIENLGWSVKYGPNIAPDMLFSERADYQEVVLEKRLRDALARLNPDLSADLIDDVYRKLCRPEGATLEMRNRNFHRFLTDGVWVQRQTDKGDTRGALAAVIDFDEPENNDWLAVNQFSVSENRITRRPDIVLFVNGLPLGVIELKNAADENATIGSAWRQLQTYKNELPSLFAMNELLMVSDGMEARIGTLTAGREWFKPWRTIAGDKLADTGLAEMQVAIQGLLERQRFLYMLRDFIVYEDEGGGKLMKKMAGYHQFYAVQAAVEETLRATAMQQMDTSESQAHDVLQGRYETRPNSGGEAGDKRIGVVWHTQGSGKSLTMVFYAGCIVREPAMSNPTLVVLSDRNDLDNQLFSSFSRCHDLLGQSPVQAANRADLRKKLSVVSGGVVFTTIHKFFPEKKGDSHPCLSDRRNIVVIADEAHRSQYDFIDGYARHMRDALPNASFVGFTGTPVEKSDANTRAVFGEYISVYDIRRSVEDGATVPIYYESRLAQLELDESERPKIDPDFDDVTEGEEFERKEKLKSKWAQLEAIVGTEKRLQLIARNIVEHYENRCTALAGKAMVVCMSRRICVELYRHIIALRPDWHDDKDEKGAIKVVMTGSAADALDWQPHIRNKSRREYLANRFRDSANSLRVVLVRDMWLTGFDAPSLHTMYVDKFMRGHGLMQAIARVNRVFHDKPGGLIVDYIGLAQELKLAMEVYTESGGVGKSVLQQDEAVCAMREKYEICCGLFHGFDWSAYINGKPKVRLSLMAAAQEHILAQEKGKERFLSVVRELSLAFALAVPHEEAMRVRDDVAFFQAVRAVLAKPASDDSRSEEDLDRAVRQIIAQAIAPEGVIDIFAVAGLKKPDISILSDEFLAEVRGMKKRNLAAELLQKLLRGEIKIGRRKNVVQARSFAEMLENTLIRYRNRAIETAQVIEELIALAKRMRQAASRGKDLKLSDDELAFYDALETNDSAVAILGDEALRDIARDLVKSVRNNVTIDWTLRENVRASLRVLVKRILHKYGYPPDKQEKATNTVLEQAEVLSEEWVKSA